MDSAWVGVIGAGVGVVGTLGAQWLGNLHDSKREKQTRVDHLRDRLYDRKIEAYVAYVGVARAIRDGIAGMVSPGTWSEPLPPEGEARFWEGFDPQTLAQPLQVVQFLGTNAIKDDARTLYDLAREFRHFASLARIGLRQDGAESVRETVAGLRETHTMYFETLNRLVTLMSADLRDVEPPTNPDEHTMAV